MQYYIITYKNKPIGESGEPCKSDYDLSEACSDCGTGAKLKGSLRVKGFSDVKKDFFETLDSDFIISTRLYNLVRETLNDFVLNQVVNSRNNYLDFYHFAGNMTLPKFNDNSTGFIIEEQCKTCKRNGYFTNVKTGNLEKNIKTIIHPYIFRYFKKDIEKYKSHLILNTWECFGLSNKVATEKCVIRFARPLTIISEKIKNIFDREKVKDIEYEKIIIE